MLLDEKELSFSDIKKKLGEHYNSGLLYHNLKELETGKVLSNERKLDYSSGRAKTSFYKLTADATDFLSKIRELFKEK